MSRGADAVALADAFGMTADPWQAIVCETILAERRDGKFVATRVGLSVPRQNGKNGVLEIVELYKLVIMGRRILHSAHEVKTARKAFLRLCEYFDNPRFPELSQMVDKRRGGIRRTNGQEAIFLTNGGSIEFIARTKGSGRGFTVDDLVLDEAQELDEFAYAALLFTISSAPSKNPQQIITGTVPGPLDNAEVFENLRASALRGKSKRDAWLEWSFERDGDPGDAAQWYRANPSLGIRLEVERVEDEYAGASLESFVRERGGVWPESGSAWVVPGAAWERCRDDASRVSGPYALCFEVTRDRSTTYVGMAGERHDGRWHLEVVEAREGVGWVLDWLRGLDLEGRMRALVIDRQSPAVSLVDALRRERFEPSVMSTGDLSAACADFYDLATSEEPGLAHIGQDELTRSLMGARQRSTLGGDAWVWSRKSPAEAAPVLAVTGALWGAMNTKVSRPSRRGGQTRMTVL